jgi:hypothetical protein
MYLLPNADGIVLLLEAGDTVDDLTRCVSLMSGASANQRRIASEHVVDRELDFAIHVQPAGAGACFTVVVPKRDDIDATVRALCAAYVTQQDSPG